MTQPHTQIYATLSEQQNPAEKDKIVRRLPPGSGLDAIGVRMKQVFDTAKEWTNLDLAQVPGLLASPWYEMRMVGASILDFKARRRGLDDDGRRRLYEWNDPLISVHEL